MTLARLFSKLRSDAKLSMRDLAVRAKPKLDPATIWKIENGRPVRAATLGQALRALGLMENAPAYIEAFALWSTEQAGNLPLEVVDKGIAKVRRAKSSALEHTLNRITAALKKTPETDWPAIVTAAEHPEALKTWLASVRLLQK